MRYFKSNLNGRKQKVFGGKSGGLVPRSWDAHPVVVVVMQELLEVETLEVTNICVWSNLQLFLVPLQVFCAVSHCVGQHKHMTTKVFCLPINVHE